MRGQHGGIRIGKFSDRMNAERVQFFLIGMQVYCICGDGDEIENLISGGEVAASIVKPAETLASTAAKEAVEYLSTGSFGSNERQYISADILTAGGIAR